MDYDTPSESTKQNELMIMFFIVFFLLWIIIPFCETTLKTLKSLNDVYHYETKPTIHDELREMEERFNDINDQKFKVVEGFGTKNNNDLLIYIITCVFVLLLVDYIFKIGKQSI